MATMLLIVTPLDYAVESVTFAHFGLIPENGAFKPDDLSRALSVRQFAMESNYDPILKIYREHGEEQAVAAWNDVNLPLIKLHRLYLTRAGLVGAFTVETNFKDEFTRFSAETIKKTLQGGFVMEINDLIFATVELSKDNPAEETLTLTVFDSSNNETVLEFKDLTDLNLPGPERETA